MKNKSFFALLKKDLKRIFLAISPIILLALLFSVSADETGNTVTGKIFKNDTTPAYNASVVLHSTALRTTYGCNCSSVAIDYSSDAGIYSSSVDNLVADEDCGIIAQGDPCPPYIIPSVDYLWITVDGSTVIDSSTGLPDPQDNTSSPKTRTWNSYTKIGTVYYGVNATFPAKDTEAPNVTLESPLNNTNLIIPDVTFEFNVSDDTSVQSCSLIINGFVNKTKTNIINKAKNNITGKLNVGNYNWSINCTDHAGNTGSSKVYNLTLTDITPPLWSPAPTNQISEFGSAFVYDVNAIDDFGISRYFVNDTTRFSVDIDGIIRNNTGLAVGIYWLNISVNDTSNNINSAIISVTVQDTTPPSWIQTPTSKTIENGTSFVYDVNATDLSGIDKYKINDTVNFAINSNTGLITNATKLDLGTYWLNISVNDTFGNMLSTIISITVTADKSAPIISDIQSQTTNNSATITWKTNINSNSTINYGTTPSLGSKVGSNEFVTSHLIAISGLTNFTLYYYNITSCNIFSNCTTVGPYNFVTQQNLPPGEVIYETRTKTVFQEIPFMPCSENWKCTDWSECTEQGIQTRICYDVESCGTYLFKPAESQSCIYKAPYKAPEFRAPYFVMPEIIKPLSAVLPWLGAIIILAVISISALTMFFSRRKKIYEKKGEKIVTNLLENVAEKVDEIKKEKNLQYSENTSSNKTFEKPSENALNKLKSLQNYVSHQLNKGFDEEYIKNKLKEKGWPEHVIDEIISISGKNEIKLTREEIDEKLAEINEELNQ